MRRIKRQRTHSTEMTQPHQTTHASALDQQPSTQAQPMETDLNTPMKSHTHLLYRDALQAVCQFLDFNEFLSTIMVNKSWYLNGRTMKSRKEYFALSRPLFQLIQSPLRSHITRLDLESYALDENGLFLLREMGHLETLTIKVLIQRPPFPCILPLPTAFFIPPHLQQLDIGFTCWNSHHSGSLTQVTEYITRCVQLIALQAKSLTSLNISLSLPDEYRNKRVNENEGPPAALPIIPTLTECSLPTQFSLNQQIDLIKSMPNVRSFNCSHSSHFDWSAESLERLVSGAGPPTQLEDIGTLSKVDERMATSLRRIATLTRLSLAKVSLSDPMTLLPYFTNLSVLTISCEENVPASQLARALSACVNITDLTLYHDQLRSEHLNQFLPHFIRLEALRLNYCPKLITLQFLFDSKSSLTHLRIFLIVGSRKLPLKEYDRLDLLSGSLEELTIFNSCMRGWSKARIAQYTPGSREFRKEAWPRLQQFHYR